MNNLSKKLSSAFIVLLISLFLSSCAEKGINSVLKVPKDFSPVYKIVQIDDLSSREIRKTRVHITFPLGLSKEKIITNIKHVIISLYKKNRPKAISILAYKEGDTLGYGFTVAMSQFAPYGEWGKAVEGNHALDKYELKTTFLDSYFLPVIQTRFGLNISQRKNIYKGVVAAQDRANKEAERLYPTDASKIPMNKLSTYDWKGMLYKNTNKSRELSKKYEKQVMKEYKLTESQLKEIGSEGAINMWPLE